MDRLLGSSCAIAFSKLDAKVGHVSTIVSDTASTMKCAARHVASHDGFQHVKWVGCFAHMLALLGKDLCLTNGLVISNLRLALQLAAAVRKGPLARCVAELRKEDHWSKLTDMPVLAHFAHVSLQPSSFCFVWFEDGHLRRTTKASVANRGGTVR